MHPQWTNKCFLISQNIWHQTVLLVFEFNEIIFTLFPKPKVYMEKIGKGQNTMRNDLFFELGH